MPSKTINTLNTILYLHNVPAYFTHIIPTKLEVDGVIYPLRDEISFWSKSKGYDHYHLRLVFFGLIKSKALILSANEPLIHLKIVIVRYKIPQFTLGMMAICLPLLSSNHSNFKVLAFILFTPLVYMMETLTNFVQIQESDSPLKQKKGA